MNKKVAIVDYGLGNLFSVGQACEEAGLTVVITADKKEIEHCDGVVLPGVGAFPDAMRTLESLKLTGLLREMASADVPFLGICLGLQLLFTKSQEFGLTNGLGIFNGEIRRFDDVRDETGKSLRIPHIGWDQIHPAQPACWANSPLQSTPNGSYFYFVHSYYACPDDMADAYTLTKWGDQEFVSGVRRGRVFGMQFHPERSGKLGLNVYREFANIF